MTERSWNWMPPQFWQTTISTSTGAAAAPQDGAFWQVMACTSRSHWDRKRPQAGQAVMCLLNKKRSTSALQISLGAVLVAAFRGIAVTVMALTVCNPYLEGMRVRLLLQDKASHLSQGGLVVHSRLTGLAEAR